MKSINTDPAPVVLFVFNRPLHTKKTIEALLKNVLAEQTELYIFSDGPRHEKDLQPVQQVREELRQIKGMKNIFIHEHEKNQGLANSVINGVTGVLKKHSKVIVLEDDLITTPDYLEYMNTALSLFEHDPSIFSVTGYSPHISIPANYPYDIYLSPRTCSYGWGVWKDRWDQVDWEIKDFPSFIRDNRRIADFNKGGEDMTIMLLKQMTGKIDSWAIRFSYASYIYGGMNVYPVGTKVSNIGFDGSGIHSPSSNKVYFKIRQEPIVFNNISTLKPDPQVLKAYQDWYRPSLIRRCINFFKLHRYRLLHK